MKFTAIPNVETLTQHVAKGNTLFLKRSNSTYVEVTVHVPKGAHETHVTAFNKLGGSGPWLISVGRVSDWFFTEKESERWVNIYWAERDGKFVPVNGVPFCSEEAARSIGVQSSQYIGTCRDYDPEIYK